MENKACDSVELDNIDIRANWSPELNDDVESYYGYQNFSEKRKPSKKKEKPFAKKALKCFLLTAMFVVIVSLGIAILVKYGGEYLFLFKKINSIYNLPFFYSTQTGLL